MNREGGASTAASRSLCAKGTASSSRACASSTRGRPSRRGDQVEVLEERPQRGRVEAGGVLAALGPARRAVRVALELVQPGEQRRAVGGAEQHERAEAAPAGRAPPAAACSRPCWPRAPPATGRRTRRAAARRRRRRRASRPGPITPSLSPWPRKSKVSAASPAAAACSPMSSWFSLRLPAPWHTSRAPRGRPAGRKSRPASCDPVGDDRDRLRRACRYGRVRGRPAPARAPDAGADDVITCEFSERVRCDVLPSTLSTEVPCTKSTSAASRWPTTAASSPRT